MNGIGRMGMDQIRETSDLIGYQRGKMLSPNQKCIAVSGVAESRGVSKKRMCRC